jgi:hypothetical protein
MSAMQLSNSGLHRRRRASLTTRSASGFKVAKSVSRSNEPELLLPVKIGECVQVAGCEGEFVVVDVDHDKGRVELLHLKPGKIESGIPVSRISRAHPPSGPHLVPTAAD